ncbi:MAG: NAD(+) kinase [Gammaproteobacteria bacterium]
MTFKRIALMGRYSTHTTSNTLERLAAFLGTQSVEIFIEADTASHVPSLNLPTVTREALGKTVDLVIVIGGDGSLLNAAHAVVDDHVPVIGVNRGLLGFLTDISPDNLETAFAAILRGEYVKESRFLLEASLFVDGKASPIGGALNDVVLYAGEIAQMIEFEMYINGQFVYSQRSDGLIIATPTGSTAYALSAGGPILHSSLEAIVLVPMFPHTLTSRPIAVSSDAIIELRVARTRASSHPAISCDGQALVALAPGATLQITRKKNTLTLIHPKDYDYYNTLRTKLDWGKPLQNKYFANPSQD